MEFILLLSTVRNEYRCSKLQTVMTLCILPVRRVIRAEFDVLKKNGHYIIGYTIIPNHTHAVIAFHNNPSLCALPVEETCRNDNSFSHITQYPAYPAIFLQD